MSEFAQWLPAFAGVAVALIGVAVIGASRDRRRGRHARRRRSVRSIRA